MSCNPDSSVIEEDGWRGTLLPVRGKDRNECLLRDLDLADLLHLRLALLLLVEELLLGRMSDRNIG